ncbi:rubredoxin [Trinickia mobilis]|uniref:rubredoxin n=1 Tax=Trinickia mobilis TaxID=2816356 RepID=UPI001A8EEF01
MGERCACRYCCVHVVGKREAATFPVRFGDTNELPPRSLTFAGLPEAGIAPGTRWEDVPGDWICPDCATGKHDFEMHVVSS